MEDILELKYCACSEKEGEELKMWMWNTKHEDK